MLLASGNVSLNFIYATVDLADKGRCVDLTMFETAVGSLFYQFCLYIALRMAHRGFSLGELGVVCFGATALWMEFLNLTIARVSSVADFKFRLTKK